MKINNQVQKAGDNSQQLQAGTIIVNNGISEERTRAIFEEMFNPERQKYSKEAFEVAQRRVDKLGNALIPRIAKIEGAVAAFADPKFQFLLKDAQKTAASTERENDYGLLTELLVCHIQKGNNRKTRASVGLAINIVDDIDNDALCALTVAHAINRYLPIVGSCREGLAVLNKLYSKLVYQELPADKEWIDHLDILGAIRITPFTRMNKIPDIQQSIFNGYTCIGIKKDSDGYSKAMKKLNGVGIDPSFLVDNELLDGYVRLPILRKNDILELVIKNNDTVRKLKENQIACLNEIWQLYSKEASLQKEVNEKFVEVWDSFESLKLVGKWWNSIDAAFSITQVGVTLAHTNAKRCDSDIPDLI